MRFKLVSLFIAALFAGGAMAAGDKAEGEKAKQGFTQLDADKDNFISAEEAKIDPTLNRVFNELDRDRDGQLSAAEYGEHTTGGAPARGY
jgi:Ca2+-binding EF-hand superfamily protein